MDAKVGDWVVTPRGKAVEINALWYNALQITAQWVRELQYSGADPAAHANGRGGVRVFNARFWYKDGGYLYDVVDGEAGDDATCRPNQVFAISLRHPVLDRTRWRPVLEVVRERLLTPVGLRSVSGSYRLQVAVPWRPPCQGRGLPPGYGLGLADRAVYRRLGQAVSRASRGGAAS